MSNPKNLSEMHGGRSKIEIAADSTVIIHYQERNQYHADSVNAGLYVLLDQRKSIAQSLIRGTLKDTTGQDAENLFEELNNRIKEILGL